MQQLPPPRIAAVHDLSCVGRCALTVVIPTLSVMGYQTVPIPTALLSSHTGGFDDLYFRDLGEDMQGIAAHFDRLSLSFRAIYTGFLGSEAQIRTVEALIDRFGGTPDESGACPLILVDPVMGDEGVLYSTYTPSLAEGMRALCHRAHVITPNLTEACLLTDTPYVDPRTLDDVQRQALIDTLLDRLARYGVPRVIITGIEHADGRVENVGRDLDGSVFSVSRKMQGVSYPGTGDLFACVLLGRLLDGDCFSSAARDAADFVGDVIAVSARVNSPVRMGVSLEPHLKHLIKEKEEGKCRDEEWRASSERS